MKNLTLSKFVFYILFLFVACIACHQTSSTDSYQPTFAADTSKNKTLIWGFPSYSYSENASLIVGYLNKRLTGAHITIKACVNWDAYVALINENKFDITLVNGIEALDASGKGYSIFGKMLDDSQSTAVIITRKDARISQPGDLKGKTIALKPSSMIPGTMMPLFYLHSRGLNVNSDIKKFNVPSFEAAIIAAYVGKSEAGLSMKRNWDVYVRDHPEILSRVELKWETPALVNNALLVNNNTDEKITSQLIRLLFSMHTNTEGKTALKQLDIKGFEPANRSTYNSTLDFKKKYDAVIH